MNYRFRKDGDIGTGNEYAISVAIGGATWGSFTWGDGTLYSSGNATKEDRVFIGPVVGKRFQHGFTNQNTVGQAFKVFSLQSTMNLRRTR